MAFWAWLLVCTLLPISGAWLPVPLAIALLLGIVLAIRSRSLPDLQLIWPLFAFYALHLVGMAWTTDIDFGLFDLQIKLGLVLLPFAVWPLVQRVPDLLHKSMVAFSLGMVVAMILGFSKAWNCYTDSGLFNCFSQSTFSFDLHPSYTSWYGCWIIAYWGYRLLHGEVTGFPRWLTVAFSVVTFLWITMLASKSGIIGLGLVLVFLCYVVVMRIKGRTRSILLGTALALVGGAVWLQGPLVKARMASGVNAIKNAFAGDPAMYTSTDGSDMRTVVWLCSIERLQQEPFGAGTGDIKHALMDCYRSRGAVEAEKRNLNSHGQFLQGGVALGWPGLIVALLIFIWPCYLAWRRKDLLLVVFAMLFVVNAAVESVLEVQAGVVFFGVVIGLLQSVRPLRSDLIDRQPVSA
ncbi:MAG: O-antigen ligase family protein [Flavobacteriales bacterium]|nr:O-antigen ligase family protein [Flavobacteriales bacterium]